jgi:uncharacterized spore protein YtfJ
MAELFESLSERLQNSANVKRVFGEPIETHDKTIIPVARIAYGFGGGSGRGHGHGKPAEGEGEGQGGGGGVSAWPLGVFEVTGTDTRFVPLDLHRKILGGVLAGIVIGVVLAGRRR